MAIIIQMATTAEQLFTQSIDIASDIRMWELRLHFCYKYESPLFFGWVFFHEQQVVDDAALVSEYMESGSIIFHVVARELRPPTQEEAIAIDDCIQLRHRFFLAPSAARHLAQSRNKQTH